MPDFRDQDNELVAALTADGVTIAHKLLQPLGKLQQQLIALQDCMAANDVAGLVQLLLRLVSGFRSGPVVDNITLQQQGAAHQGRY